LFNPKKEVQGKCAVLVVGNLCGICWNSCDLGKSSAVEAVFISRRWEPFKFACVFHELFSRFDFFIVLGWALFLMFFWKSL